MNTQENYSSFREDDEKMDEKIGMGLNEFTENQVTGMSAFNEMCSIKNAGSPSVYSSVQCFVSSQQELHEAVEKKSGLTINLGFGSLGHHKSTIRETTISKKSLNLFIRTEREAGIKQLDIAAKNQSTYFSGDAAQLIKDAKKEDFYTRFGSKYVSKSKTGYFMHTLIVFKCNSEQEVESKKKELEATLKTENGSGSASLGSNKNFTNFCEKNGAFVYESHNIPPDLIKDIPGYTSQKNALLKALILNDTIESFSLDKASVMDHEISVYPLTANFFANFNDVETELLALGKQLESSQEELDTIREYEDRSFVYESVPDLQQRKDFFTDRLSHLQLLAKHLSANPWEKNAEIDALRKNIAAKAPEKLTLRVADVNCITSGLSWFAEAGIMIAGTADAANSLKTNYALTQLGICLNKPVNPSDLSIQYEVFYNTSGVSYSKKGINGSITDCLRMQEINSFVEGVTVSLTGTLAEKYTVHLTGITYYGLLTDVGTTVKSATIKAPYIPYQQVIMSGILGVAVYLSPKKG